MSVEERQRARAEYLRKAFRVGSRPPAEEILEPLSGDRRGQIIRLLRTRNDHLPVTRAHAAASPAGFAHRTKAVVTCPDCLANGKAMPGCETWRRRGDTEEHTERDPYAVSEILPFGFDVSRHDQTRARDRELQMLDRQLARPQSLADELADANVNPYAWEQARRRMYRLYDYGALDDALELVRERAPSVHSALMRFYVDRPLGDRDEPVGLARNSCEMGFNFLHQLLPAKLRAPEPEPEKRVRGPLHSAAGPDARELRDAEMRQRAEAGEKPADLAREFGVSIRTVYQVVNG